MLHCIKSHMKSNTTDLNFKFSSLIFYFALLEYIMVPFYSIQYVISYFLFFEFSSFLRGRNIYFFLRNLVNMTLASLFGINLCYLSSHVCLRRRLQIITWKLTVEYQVMYMITQNQKTVNNEQKSSRYIKLHIT